MKKIGIFYGSSSANTQQVAHKLAASLNINKDDVYDIGKGTIAKMEEYDYLLLGSSTWGLGDIQDDWDLSKLANLDLTNKKIAVFGTGDSVSYSDTFCDALEQLAQTVQIAGATLIGNKVEASQYSFGSSISVKDGYFCGLPIDEDNECEKTDLRIEKWVVALNQDFEA